MRTIRFILSLLIITLLFSCRDNLNLDKNSVNLQNKSSKSGNISLCEGIKIAILSDIHVMDPSLLVNDGPAFQAYLAKDQKLLEFSKAILQATVNKLITQKPDLVLISGDLTKDGEKVSHETVIGILKQLTDNGITVLVTPGNHDINNPDAMQFDNATTTPVATIQADDFQTMYADFGFSNAISKDPNSLSYVNEPITGLWVIAIDANKYYENTTTSTVGGVIKPETMRWVKQQLVDAKNKNKTVIGLMHHGLIEHYIGQNQVDPGYVVDNTDQTAKKLIDDGLKIMLTGHYHATDITKREHANKFIYDVETGSIVAYPCTYRMLEVKNNVFSFAPQSTTDLMGAGFDTYAKTFLTLRLNGYFEYVLKNLYGVPEPYAAIFGPFYRAAAMAHFAGDEVMPTDVGGQLVYLNSADPSGKLAWILNTIWTDLYPADNLIAIDMKTGQVQ